MAMSDQLTFYPLKTKWLAEGVDYRALSAPFSK